MQLPTLESELVTPDGQLGWIGSWCSHTSDDSMEPLAKPFKEQLIDETRCSISVDAPKGLTRRWTLRLKGRMKPMDVDREYEFGLISAGRAKVHFGAFHVDA
jgi:beta-glucosidase